MKKKKINLLLICYLCQIFFLCSCTACKHNSRKITKQQTFDYSQLVDDSVKKWIGDSIMPIIFNSDKVELYALSMTPLSTDSTKKDSLISFHDCYIAKNYGTLTADQLTPILFLLSDKDTYSGVELLITTPFSPYAALHFQKGDSIVDIIFSISGGRMKIYTQNNVSDEIKYAQERLFIRFFQYALNDEKLQRLLKLL